MSAGPQNFSISFFTDPMTPDQNERITTALESIANDIWGIRLELDPDKENSGMAQLIKTLDKFHIDTGAIESSLDDLIKPQLERIADRLG